MTDEVTGAQKGAVSAVRCGAVSTGAEVGAPPHDGALTPRTYNFHTVHTEPPAI